MARVDGLPRAALHDGGDDIVYDSQEELDQWPDSQIVPESEPGAIETVEEPRSSGKLQVFRSERRFLTSSPRRHVLPKRIRLRDSNLPLPNYSPLRDKEPGLLDQTPRPHLLLVNGQIRRDRMIGLCVISAQVWIPTALNPVMMTFPSS